MMLVLSPVIGINVNLLATILRWLHENNFTINPLKNEWAINKLTGLVIGLHHEA